MKSSGTRVKGAGSALKRLVIGSLLGIATSREGEGVCSVGGASVPSDARREADVRRTGETLILNEEFDNFNLDLWKHEITMGGGGNWEFQVYGNNRTNSYVKDGKLFLQPTLTSDYLGEDQVSGVVPTTLDIWGMSPADQCTSNMFFGCSRGSDVGARHAINPTMSARVRTAGTFSFRYGRIEITVKLPKGDWLWPAVWLLPENNDYGQWPASGEIDIVESRGNPPSYGEGVSGIGGVDTASSAVHWGPHYSMDSWDLTYGTMKLDGRTFNDDFHTFGLYWDETQMYTYVDSDDNRLLTVDFGIGTSEEGFWRKGHFDEKYPGIDNPWTGRGAAAPYDQRFYVVMNVAVGGVGGFFPDGVGGKMWANNDEDAAMKFYEATPQWFSTWDGTNAAMQVDSVKVWQKKTDYYFGDAARASLSGTGSTPSLDQGTTSSSPHDVGGGVDDFGHGGGSGGGASNALLYLGCALIGSLLGAGVVGWSLQRQNSRRWSRMYRTINGNDVVES